jgi:TctA family transporter
MIMTQGNLLAIVERPIVLAFLILTVASLVWPLILKRLRFRGKAVVIEQEQA